MSPLEDRLSQAVAELRDDVDALAAPPFTAKRSTVVVLFVLVSIGIAAFAARSGSGETGGVSVATQPDRSDIVGDHDPQVPANEISASIGSPMIGQLTNAESGEFLMPLPAGVAWSNNESQLLMYRTGDAQPGHLVVDTATGQVVGASALPFTPADIEQVYWHPSEDSLLVYTTDADLMVHDLDSGQSRVVQSFDQCDRVDSGALPVPLSNDATMSLLCHVGSGSDQLVVDLATGEFRQVTTSSDTAAVISPSGRSLVRWNSDGSASVLNADLAETGVTLDLDNNLFVFLADNSGREWIATTLFDGPVVGTIVLLPLDGADPPVVVIGPDRGDSYPPSGTSMSASGGVVAVSLPGADDGVLVGRIVAVDLHNADLSASFSDESFNPTERVTFAHGAVGVHDYWSKPFLSVSPSGRYLAYATDQGSDRVQTVVATATGRSTE